MYQALFTIVDMISDLMNSIIYLVIMATTKTATIY